MEEKKFLDVQELTDYIHMSESYVYKMVSKKSIPHIKLGTRTLFERNQIDNWVINGGQYGREPSCASKSLKINVMATFNIVLDKRKKLKGGKYNLAVRMVNGNDVMYINIQKMTESQYDKVFNNKVKDEESRKFLDTCNGYISKCNKIFSELKPFNKETSRKRFWETDKDKPKSLILTELFDYYIENKENIKPTTIDSLRYTRNRFENFKAGLTVGDVTVSFLKKFEKNEIDKDNSRATIDHHMRNLRSILNYFIHYVKVIPKEYEYPFGPGGFTVSGYFPSTQVLKESEIQSVIDLNEFKSEDHRFARDIWVLLYRFNGANFADLLRMKWSQINGDYIFFTRKKTEDTRKNNRKAYHCTFNG